MGIYGSICSTRLAHGSDRKKETEEETWPGRERKREGERRKQGNGEKCRLTERLIRICLFSLVRQGLRGWPSGRGGKKLDKDFRDFFFSICDGNQPVLNLFSRTVSGRPGVFAFLSVTQFSV